MKQLQTASTLMGEQGTDMDRNRFATVLSQVQGLSEALQDYNRPRDVQIAAKILQDTLGIFEPLSDVQVTRWNGSRYLTGEEALYLAQQAVVDGVDLGPRMSAGQKQQAFFQARTNMTLPAFYAAIQGALMPAISKIVIEKSISRKFVPIDEAPGGFKRYRLKDRQLPLLFAEGGVAPSHVPHDSYQYVHTYKDGRAVEITVEDKKDLDFDRMREDTEDAAKELLSSEDRQCWELLFRGTSGGRASTTANAEYPNGESAPPASKTVEGNAIYLPIDTTPTPSHVMEAVAYLRNRGYDPTVILANPYSLAALYSQQVVMAANERGNSQIQDKGFVDVYFGLLPLWSSQLPLRRIYFLEIADGLRIAQTDPMTLWPDPHFGIDKSVLSIRRNEVLRNANAIEAIQWYES